MALPSCRLSSAINYTFSSPGKKDALCPPHTHTKCMHTHTKCMDTHIHTHTAAAEGQTPAECLSPLLLASATAWHCGRDGHLLSARLDWKGASGRGASCCSFLLAWAVWSVVLLRCLCCSHSYRRFLGLKKQLQKKKNGHGEKAKLDFAFNKHETQLWSRCYTVKSNCSVFSGGHKHIFFFWFQEIQRVLIAQKSNVPYGMFWIH